MTTALSILVSSSLAGFLFCLLKLIKINRITKINSAEPIKIIKSVVFKDYMQWYLKSKYGKKFLLLFYFSIKKAFLIECFVIRNCLINCVSWIILKLR